MTSTIEIRYVVHLPVGVARAIAFDGLGHELGNGWLDLTRRIEQADPDQWLPIVLDGDDRGDDMLHDAGRKVFRPDRIGDLIRKPTSRAAQPYVYLVNAGDAWYACDRLAPHVVPRQ
jgi:hypothetical protein